MNDRLTTYNYLEDYLNKILSKGRHAFTLNEVKDAFPVSEKAIAQSMYRLTAKKKIAQIRKGFYAIITPEYSIQGMVPVHLFIDDLMKSLDRNYYVGLFSAAALHGAAHQQPMEYFVITENPPLRTIKNQKLKLNFFVKKDWQEKDIIQKKTEAGYIPVSSPELTALDLFVYLDKIGINRIATIISELAEEMNASRLADTAQRYPQTSAIQKLGYLLDKEMDQPELANALLRELKMRRVRNIPLATGKQDIGIKDEIWRISVNTTIDMDI